MFLSGPWTIEDGAEPAGNAYVVYFELTVKLVVSTTAFAAGSVSHGMPVESIKTVVGEAFAGKACSAVTPAGVIPAKTESFVSTAQAA
jgi:hypothetical protein